jgi:uncharacterized membrane protein YjgN (DUF898 family)
MNDPSTTAGPASAVRELPFEFRATGAEYFRIWIVNLLLTLVTLGIYSAWAKVRRLRYFYGSTSLDGNSFEYHGRPIAILKGRLIVVGLYVVFAVLVNLWPLAQVVIVPLAIFGVPWIIVKARLFQMRMTSWRGLRFNFHGKYGGAFACFMGWMLLGIITLGVLWPMALWKQVNFLATNTAYGSQRFGFTSRIGDFYRVCLTALGLLVAMGLVGLVVMLLLRGTAVAALNLEPGSRPDISGAMAFGLVVGVALASFVVGAYYRAHFLNISIGGVVVGPHRASSRLHTLPLLGIFITNLLGMIVTLGLFYPWAKVRLLRYQLANTSMLVDGDIGQFVADADPGPDALAEEAGDFFDVDFGI